MKISPSNFKYSHSKLLAWAFISLLISPLGAAQTKPLDDERAVAQLKMRLKQNPKDPHSLFKMGWYMQKMNFLFIAQDYYQQCVAVSPRYVSAFINLGNIDQRLKHFPKAERLYRRAIVLDKHSADAHYNLGTLYLKMKKYPKAIREFEITLALKPRNKAALLNLASIYLVLHRKKPQRRLLKLAKKRLIEAGQLDRRYAHVYFNLAKVFELEQNYGVAIHYYKEAIRFYRRDHRFKRKAADRIRYLRAKKVN